MPRETRHLIGAYGLFWERHAVDWDAPRSELQLFGCRHQRLPSLQVCDFAAARGVYLLFNEYGPTYVGQARGNTGGVGYRLRTHHKAGFKDWSRFCWFSFDSVKLFPASRGWCDVVRDEHARSISAESAINDLEALMIVAFGLKSQNQMALAGAGSSWRQLTADDCLPGGVARKVDADFIRTRSLRAVLELHTSKKLGD